MKIQRVLLFVPATLLVAACGAAATSHSLASSPDQSSAGSAKAFRGSMAPVAVPQPAELGVPVTQGSTGVAAGSGTASDGSGSASAPANAPSPSQGPAIISQGQISLRVNDPDAALFNLQKLLDTWHGTIATEQSTADPRGRTDQTRIELRIPSSRFDEAMNALSQLGTLVDRSRSSQDVTTQVIDINTRVRSQQLSLARIQALLAQAQNLNQIIAIESELSQRQADLDSLVQQQKYLADQTSLATIDLYLTVPGKTPSHHKAQHGFWSGLKSGWHHLGTATAAVLNAVGNALPFALVLGVIALPCWLVWRRRTSKAVATSGPLEV